jgi:predicted MPP superfamily phosphohydrolase
MLCLYHGSLLLIALLQLYPIWRSSYTPFLHFLVLAGIGVCVNVFLAAALSGLMGDRVSAHFVLYGLAWHGGCFLFATAFLMYRQRRSDGKPRRTFPSLILIFACIYCGVALDALVIEPWWLVVRKTTLPTSKITEPITIVFCSDMQAERIGSYERRTLQKIKEQNADLILFGGDYFQTHTVQETQKILQDWNQLFREIDLQAPLGIYAVRGNLDLWHDWETMFTGTAIIPKEQTVTEQIGEIRVTFLSLGSSLEQRSIPDEERGDKFRIIVGHTPKYAMAAQDADLLLAGHTHGGQVQIPFFGPLVTASGNLSRKWATGTTSMPNGATLMVSHGSGHERGRAPRVRFYCRPDILVIRLVPE